MMEVLLLVINLLSYIPLWLRIRITGRPSLFCYRLDSLEFFFSVK